MKRLVLLLAVSAFAAESPSLSQLDFMTGCWSGSKGAVSFEERWMAPAGGSMLGIARTLKGGKTIFFETFALMEKDGETTMFVRLRMDDKTTPFKLIKSGGGEAVFSNPEHDFPQRIIYRKTGDGSLLGRIEGMNKGKEAFEDFPMKRSACQ